MNQSVQQKSEKSLAFVPLDIEVPEVDFDLLEDWVDMFSVANIQERLGIKGVSKSRYAFNLAPAIAKGDFTDYKNVQQLHYESFANRMHNEPAAIYQNGFDKEFPEFVELLNKLPLTINHFEVLQNKASIFSHCDEWEVEGEFVDPLWGPFWSRTDEQIDSIVDSRIPVSLIKVFLYENPQHKKKSFYMAKDLLSDPVYCWGPESCFVAALSKVVHPHGADMIPDDGSRKFVFNIHGVLDVEKHQKMVEEGLKKYGEYACWF